MRRAIITEQFQAAPQEVWDIVTNNEDFSWRSDLAKIQIEKDGTEFTEYTKDGFSTHFTITEKDPLKRYAFEMSNKSFTGSWIGLFHHLPDGGTELVFTEEVRFKNALLELVSHIFLNLKKMQQTYMSDLKKRLNEPLNLHTSK